MDIHKLRVKKLFDAAGLGKDDVLKVIVIPDKHFPDHCKKTHKATLQFAKDYAPHALLSIGDWWEMGSMSHWEGNANFCLLREELEGGLEMLEHIADTCGDQLIYKAITLGNHELWYKRHISQQAPGLRKFLKESGMDIHFANISGLEDAGYEVFEYNEGLEIGDNIYTHGTYTGTHHGKKHVDVVQKTVLYGHTETQQLYTQITARGINQGISLGTQRDESKCIFLNGQSTNWVTAVGIVEYRYDGSSTIYNPRIINGKFSFGGKIYG
jgi:hypothetical protein